MVVSPSPSSTKIDSSNKYRCGAVVTPGSRSQSHWFAELRAGLPNCSSMKVTNSFRDLNGISTVLIVSGQ